MPVSLMLIAKRLRCTSAFLAYSNAQAADGRRLFADQTLAYFTLERHVSETPASLVEEFGEGNCEAIVAYLRRHPGCRPCAGPPIITCHRKRVPY